MQPDDKVTDHTRDNKEQTAAEFLRERIAIAPTWPARIVRADSREQMKEFALKAYAQCLDEAMEKPFVKDTLLIGKVPIVLWYGGETEPNAGS